MLGGELEGEFFADAVGGPGYYCPSAGGAEFVELGQGGLAKKGRPGGGV